MKAFNFHVLFGQVFVRVLVAYCSCGEHLRCHLSILILKPWYKDVSGLAKNNS